MNKDGDYSAAYVVVHTDDPAVKGYGFTFTIGRGNDLCVRGGPPARPAPDRRDRWRMRSLTSAATLPRSRVRLAAALARPGEGRRPPRDGRGHERDVGPRRPARGQAAVATARRHDSRAARRRRRPAVPVGRAHARRGDRDAQPSWRRRGPRASPSSRHAAATPATRRAPAGSATATTSCARLLQEAVDEGYRHVKLKVGADLEDDIRRLRIAREVIGWDANLMIDANQVWDVPEAIEWMSHSGRVQAAVDRGADEPRRHPRPRRDPPRGRAHRRRDRRARHEPGAVQAAVPGRGDRLLPARLGAAGERQRDPRGVPDGEEVRRAGVPARRAGSGCANWCSTCRSSTSCACREHSRTASPSSSTTCTSTSSIPASSRTAVRAADAARLQRRCTSSRSPSTRSPAAPTGGRRAAHERHHRCAHPHLAARLRRLRLDHPDLPRSTTTQARRPHGRAHGWASPRRARAGRRHAATPIACWPKPPRIPRSPASWPGFRSPVLGSTRR